ncbi:MAG: hypothetical protein WDN31_04660 [Hyphomicrobium sp.]
MLKFLRRLFAGPSSAGDEKLHPQSPSEERISLLDVDEPMAGAGALLAGAHIKSETEKALERASGQEND